MHAFIRTESVGAGILLESDTDPTAVLWASYTLLNEEDKVDNMEEINDAANTISVPLNHGDDESDVRTKFTVALQSRHNDVTAVTFLA